MVASLSAISVSIVHVSRGSPMTTLLGRQANGTRPSYGKRTLSALRSVGQKRTPEDETVLADEHLLHHDCDTTKHRKVAPVTTTMVQTDIN
ncbi:hypothetical protein PsorP6_003679 [Peronosclerospora sorghi]|uniref:Uncharacterized protein n=1 Tax=Peronosclerospora sorghi TaxID=230839 RepID=A0ACC0VPZ6_9STRA|nr:hypothetical protein PsorP6_003679 [Peronosclerospora sorghi]